MLSNIQMAAFQLHSKVFWYLPELPFSLEKSGSNEYKYEISSSKFKWLSTIILFILMLLHAIMCGMGLLYWGFYLPLRSIDNVALVNFGIEFFCHGGGAILAFTVFPRIASIMGSVNDFIRLETTLRSKIRKLTFYYGVHCLLPLRGLYIITLYSIQGGLNQIITIW